MDASSAVPSTVTFEAFGVQIRLTLGDDDLVGRVRNLLPPGARPVSPSPDANEFRLRRLDAQTCEVTFEALSEPYAAPLEMALGMLDANIRLCIAEKARDYVFVHAGAVAVADRAIVMPGKSHAGKSTLVKALIDAGASYYSDEYAVFDAQGQIHPYPRPLSLRHRDYSQFPGATGAIIGDKPVELAAVVIARYEPGSDWKPRRLTAGEGLTALLANAIPAQARPDASLQALGQALNAHTPVLEGRRGEAATVAGALLREFGAAGAKN